FYLTRVLEQGNVRRSLQFAGLFPPLALLAVACGNAIPGPATTDTSGSPTISSSPSEVRDCQGSDLRAAFIGRNGGGPWGNVELALVNVADHQCRVRPAPEIRLLGLDKQVLPIEAASR